MRNSILKIIFLISLMALSAPVAFAEANPKVMVLDFQLNDLTDLPNAPEELTRIAYLTSTFKQKLVDNGIEIVPMNDRLKAELLNQSPTYLFDRAGLAAKMAEGSGADYLLIGVALKPTYLFVYPRILLVDIKTQEVVMAAARQLESSWLDENTTARGAEKLAVMVSEKLKNLVKQAN